MIGYYVHHHGRGHLARAGAVAARLRRAGRRAELAARAGRPTPSPAGCRCRRTPPLPDPLDPTAGGTLHWAPLDSPRLPRPDAAPSPPGSAPAAPRLVHVDVSVEVAALVRLLGVPVRRHRDARRARTTAPTRWPTRWPRSIVAAVAGRRSARRTPASSTRTRCGTSGPSRASTAAPAPRRRTRPRRWCCSAPAAAPRPTTSTPALQPRGLGRAGCSAARPAWSDDPWDRAVRRRGRGHARRAERGGRGRRGRPAGRRGAAGPPVRRAARDRRRARRRPVSRSSRPDWPAAAAWPDAARARAARRTAGRGSGGTTAAGAARFAQALVDAA